MSQIHAELNDNELIICCDRARMTENALGNMIAIIVIEFLISAKIISFRFGI